MLMSLRDAVIAAGLGDVAGAVDVRGPEHVGVDGVVGELRGAVEDGGEVAFEETAQEGLVADVALDACKVRVLVGVGDEIDVVDGVAFGEETAFEDASEEAGAAGDQDFLHHRCCVYFSGLMRNFWWWFVVRARRPRLRSETWVPDRLILYRLDAGAGKAGVAKGRRASLRVCSVVVRLLVAVLDGHVQTEQVR
jgi:hypothetical protein